MSELTLRSILLLVLLGLAACATQPQFTLLGPGRQKIGDAYSVEPQRSWSRLALDNGELWTVDGPLLEEVRLVDGLSGGDALLAGVGDQQMPVYREDMAPSEIMELVTDSLAAAGAVDAHASNLRPAEFGGLPGFRFDLDFLTEAGLEKQGFAVGTVEDGRLHLIMFTAARQHYYPLYRGTVERLIESIVVT